MLRILLLGSPVDFSPVSHFLSAAISLYSKPTRLGTMADLWSPQNVWTASGEVVPFKTRVELALLGGVFLSKSFTVAGLWCDLGLLLERACTTPTKSWNFSQVYLSLWFGWVWGFEPLVLEVCENNPYQTTGLQTANQEEADLFCMLPKHLIEADAAESAIGNTGQGHTFMYIYIYINTYIQKYIYIYIYIISMCALPASNQATPWTA